MLQELLNLSSAVMQTAEKSLGVVNKGIDAVGNTANALEKVTKVIDNEAGVLKGYHDIRVTMTKGEQDRLLAALDL